MRGEVGDVIGEFGRGGEAERLVVPRPQRREQCRGLVLQRAVVDQHRVATDIVDRRHQRIARLPVGGMLAQARHVLRGIGGAPRHLFLERGVRFQHFGRRERRRRHGERILDDGRLVDPGRRPTIEFGRRRRLGEDRARGHAVHDVLARPLGRRSPRHLGAEASGREVEVEGLHIDARPLDLFDIETHGAEVLRELGIGGLVDRRVLVAEALDGGARMFDGAMDVVVAEQRQRTARLAERLLRLGEAGTFGRVAEERVEDLLGIAQVGLHLGDEARYRQPFLGLARHAVEPFDLGRGMVAAEDGGLDACRDESRALVEGVVERAGAFERAFEEQQRRGHIESDVGLRLARVEAEVGGDAVDHLRDLREPAPPDRSDRIGQRRGLLRERRDLRDVAGNDRRPRDLRGRQRFARMPQGRRVDASVALHLEVLRHHEPVAALHLADQRRHRGGHRHDEEDVGVQAFGDDGRSFDELADLQVDAPREALDVRLLRRHGREAVVGERLEERTGGPPERTLLPLFRRRRDRVVDRRDRAAQGRERGAVLLVAQVTQQGLFERAPLLLQPGFVECTTLIAARRPDAEIDHEQVGRMDAIGASRGEQIAIARIQIQRLLVRTGLQVLEILDEGAAGADDGVERRRIAARRLLLEAREQFLDGLGDPRRARELAELESAVRLMDVRPCHAKRCEVDVRPIATGRTGAEGAQRGRGRVESGDDLGQQPADRAGVDAAVVAGVELGAGGDAVGLECAVHR